MKSKHLRDILGPVTRISKVFLNIQGSLGEMDYTASVYFEYHIIFKGETNYPTGYTILTF